MTEIDIQVPKERFKGCELISDEQALKFHIYEVLSICANEHGFPSGFTVEEMDLRQDVFHFKLKWDVPVNAKLAISDTITVASTMKRSDND